MVQDPLHTIRKGITDQRHAKQKDKEAQDHITRFASGGQLIQSLRQLITVYDLPEDKEKADTQNAQQYGNQRMHPVLFHGYCFMHSVIPLSD